MLRRMIVSASVVRAHRSCRPVVHRAQQFPGHGKRHMIEGGVQQPGRILPMERPVTSSNQGDTVRVFAGGPGAQPGPLASSTRVPEVLLHSPVDAMDAVLRGVMVHGEPDVRWFCRRHRQEARAFLPDNARVIGRSVPSGSMIL